MRITRHHGKPCYTCSNPAAYEVSDQTRGKSYACPDHLEAMLNDYMLPVCLEVQPVTV